jgi:hypothetical protein
LLSVPISFTKNENKNGKEYTRSKIRAGGTQFKLDLKNLTIFDKNSRYQNEIK